LNTFSSGNGLRTFFRKSFRLLEANGVENLVLDVRANGGGDANLAILLTRYLISRPFRVADSLYAVKNSSAYARYIDHRFLYSTAMRLITKREEAERLHFRYFERHVFPPKKKNRFEGNVYLIIGGNSFSATTVFLKMVQGEKNVTVVGEETGGGRYGNSAWMLPQVTLPKTGIRFTLPLFRMVMDKTAVASGTGILPDVHAGATQESIRKDEDPKMLKTFELIAQRKKKSAKESAY
jgi:C-terminal processing protease CtpA/Prc